MGAPFPDLCLHVPFYDKCDDFDFDMIYCQCLNGDVCRRASYGVYISDGYNCAPLVADLF